MSSPRRVRPLVAALATLGFAALALAVPAPALAANATWYVDQANGVDAPDCGTAAGPDACATIAQAVDFAEDTDTISIASGDYVEALVIDKSLTLQGAGLENTSISTNGEAANVTAAIAAGTTTAPTITIDGIRLASDFYPALVVDGATVLLQNSQVSGENEGMRFFRGAVTVQDSIFEGNGNAIIVGYSVTVDDQGTAALIIRDSEFTDNLNGAVVEFHEDATVTIENTLIEDTHFGTGVSSDNVSISHSTIRNNGRGGIDTGGDVQVTDSTIADNFGVGVTLYDGGRLDMARTTVSGTKPYADEIGSSQPLGAGVLAWPDSSGVIDSSTIWGNTGQGVLSGATSMAISNSTIGGTAPGADVGGGGIPTPPAAVAVLTDFLPPELEIELSLSLTGSIVSGSADVPACTGDVTDAGYNLATDDSCALSETSLNSTDPQLGELAGNGGPTQTVLPAFGPAVDAIPAGAAGRDALNNDQRGASFARLIGARGDIGAVEVAQDPVVITPDALPAGKVGEEYSVALSATGGTGAPYAWSLVEPTLPDGLELSTEGVISGIPTEEGTFSITVNVDDGAATKDYSVTVTAADVVVPDPDPPVDPDPVDPAPVDPGTGEGSEDAGTLPATGGDPSAALTLGALLLLAGGAVFAGARGLRRIRG